MRLIPLTLGLALALTGCSSPVGLDLGGALGGKPAGSPATGNRPVEPLAGITFRPLSAANAQYLSSQGGGATPNMARAESAMAKTAAAPAPAMGMAADAAMPAVTGGGTPGQAQSIGGAYSGNVWGGLGYQYYFGFGGNEQMSLVSVQEAETSGSSGGFNEALAIVAPVVKDWAADARLTETRSALNNEGKLGVRPMPAVMDMAMPGVVGSSPFNEGEGWRFVYVSSSRNEMLQFMVMPDKTSILRLGWAPLNLDPARVKVGSQAAIAALIKAVGDRSFRGEEETNQKDYFFGHAFTQPKTGEWDNENQQTEILYQVPAKARWNVSLQQVVGKLVWDINWYAADDSSTSPGVAEPGVVGGSEPGSAPSADIGVNEPGVSSGGIAVEAPGTVVSSAGNGGLGAAYRARFQLMQASAIAIAPAPPTLPQPCAGGVRQEKNVYTNNSGQGMVDAETGAIIRFTRPTRVTNTWSNWVCDEPTAKPAERLTGQMRTPGVYITEKYPETLNP